MPAGLAPLADRRGGVGDVAEDGTLERDLGVCMGLGRPLEAHCNTLVANAKRGLPLAPVRPTYWAA